MKHRFRSTIEQARGPGATVALVRTLTAKQAPNSYRRLKELLERGDR